jgi:hypothetical protein
MLVSRDIYQEMSLEEVVMKHAGWQRVTLAWARWWRGLPAGLDRLRPRS